MEKIKQGSIGDRVLFKDNQLIIFNKPNGLVTMGEHQADKSLLSLAEIYCHHPVYALHRLDQPTSGVVLFAKNKKALSAMSEQLRTGKIIKTYWAWVKGKPPKEGELNDFLWRDGKIKKARIVDESHAGAKLASLRFKSINSTDHYALLEIELISGRFHQIRAQLAHQGWPIQGDQKYGAKRGNPDRSIALHARSLTFTHPTKGQSINIQAPPPQSPLWNTL